MAESASRSGGDPLQNEKRFGRRCGYGSEATRDRLLLEISELAVGSRRVLDLLQAIAPQILSLTDCDFLQFSLHDRRQDCMINHYWNRSLESGQLNAISPDDCLGGWVWKHQEKLIISDVEKERRFPLCMQELRKLADGSYFMLPLTVAGHRFGAMGLGKRATGEETDAEEFECFEWVAFVVSLALENQNRRGEWEEQRERLQGLVTIGRELSSSPDLDRLTGDVLKNLRTVVRHDHSAVMLLEDDGKVLRRCAIDSPWQAYGVQADRVPVEQAVSARAIQSGEVVSWKGVDLAKLGTPVGRELSAGGIQSFVNIPLLAAGQAWGSLDVGSTQREAFGEADIEYLQQVANLIGAAFRNASAYRELAQLRDHSAGEKRYSEREIRSQMRWDEIVGASASLKRVLDYASIVAATDSTVLITGETGAGKERIAHAIHSMSRRKGCAFIKVNCAAIPTGLLESELFGHERGAFTGAVSQKIGRLERADKGTLFLDEIGEVPLELQPKLLRVLQDQEFERLGGTRTIRVDARLIAATNRDLTRAVEEKQFRSDLFYRLHVFPLHVPALRDRREDIPLLVRYFVEKSSARLGRRIESVPEEAMEAILQWNWPGNVRELENFIERSVILSDDTILRAPLAELRQEIARQKSGADATLQDREREHIVDVLRDTRGVLSGPRGAAARLGLKRTTLQYKLQRLDISRMEYLE